MSTPVMPAGSFEVLFEFEESAGIGLPEAFRAVYGGDWRLPCWDEYPYLCVNFVVSRDGRVSFGDPEHIGGVHVARFDPCDRWLMGLLRARADAVLVGEGTLRTEPNHVWTAEDISPEDAEAFSALRQHENRRTYPLQVVLTLSGDIPPGAAMLARPELRIVFATTATGARHLRERVRGREACVDVLELGETEADIRRLVHALADRYAVRVLLCEGGPRVYGSLLRAGLPLDEFLTLSPLVLGDDDEGPPRPSLVEGVRFPSGSTPVPRLLSVRRAGDYLYLRSRYPSR